MESRQPKVNVSFSIENILRDDFPYRQKANETVSLPTSETNFERWPNTAVYQYYAAHFSPVVVRSLPNMHRVEGRFNGCNGGREQILCQEHNTTAGYSRCQDESALQHKKGKNYVFPNLMLGEMTSRKNLLLKYGLFRTLN